MNKYHEIYLPNDYWKTIIYAWLFLNVNLIHNYWVLSDLLKRRKTFYNIYKIDEQLLAREGSRDMSRQSEYFHFWILSELIKFKNFFKYSEKKYRKKKEDSRGKKFSLVKYFFKYISKFTLFFVSPNVFINDLGVKNKYALYLNLKLKQFPLIWFEPNFKHERIDIAKRKKYFYQKENENNFNNFFNSVIYKIIPKAYLENFKNINSAVKNFWPQKINKILTMNIYSSDVFNIWVANMKRQRAKLYIFQHGGYYGMNKFHDGEYVESFVADKFFTWGWKSNKKKIIPFYSLAFNTDKLTRSTKSENHGENVIFCIQSNTRYLSLPGYFPRNNFQRIERLFLIKNTLTKLKSEIKKKIIIRYREKQFLRNSMLINKKFFGKNLKFDNGSIRLINYLDNAKLVIHDNSGTGWLETTFHNVPTVIIIDKNIEGFKSKFSKNFNELKKNKIIHFSSLSLSNFLNKNYNNIERWWNSNQVQRSVQSFKREYIKCSNDPINDLVTTIRRL